jgi:hypothetical protein
MTADESSSPPAEKKQKSMLAQSPDEDWPEAWLMMDEVEDQKLSTSKSPIYPSLRKI